MPEQKSKKILVLGYGEMGHAMEHLLGKCHTLYFWDKKQQAGFHSAILEDVAPLADFVIFCLPVNPHRIIAQQIAPLIRQDCICLSIAKGLDEQGQTAAQIFADIFRQQPHALLYGPMISEEIRADRYAFAQLGCSQQALFRQVNNLFSGSKLFIEQSDDIAGISWSVILKNVYAIAFGIADELKLGDNVRGYLAVSALHELSKIVQIMGGKQNSPFHLAGLGDLITTATSEDSHHHELGRKLARGDLKDINGEGIHTLSMVQKFQLFRWQDFPLFTLIADIVKKPQNITERIDQYFSA